MSSNRPIKIAIIGGGLAGATLMNALTKHPHLSCEIFESASDFSERGAAVGIAQNGQAALTEIGGSFIGVLDRAGAVSMSTRRVKMVCNELYSGRNEGRCLWMIDIEEVRLLMLFVHV